MCRAVPVLVIRIDGNVVWVDDRGREQAISLFGLDGVSAGDYVYCHAGVALGRLGADEAREILGILVELDSVLEDDLPYEEEV